jgi:hypothetical protein
VGRSRRTAGLCAFALFLGAGASRAVAQSQTDYELAVAANLNASSTGPTTGDQTTRMLLDLRPGVLVQSQGARVSWRASYTLSTAFDFEGGSASYANAAELGLQAHLSPRVALALAASALQGGTAFQLTQGAADAGQAALRDPANPDRVAGGLTQTLDIDAAPDVRVAETLSGLFSSDQDHLDRADATFNAILGFDKRGPTDAFGADARSTLSWLHPVSAVGDHYVSLINTLLGRYTRTWTRSWSSAVTLGVQQVVTFAGSEPLAFLPTGSLSLSWTGDRATGGLLVTHTAVTNLQTGTVGQGEQAALRLSYPLSPLLLRALNASVGALHTEPIGQSSARVSTGTGTALQADVGLSWELAENVVATLRYSFAYQFGQPDVDPSMAHALIVGLTARMRTGRLRLGLPGLGGASGPESATTVGDEDAEDRR